MQSLWEILGDGGRTRQVVEMNTDGTLGVALGKAVGEDLDTEAGDTVGMSVDEDERTVTYHFGPSEGEGEK